MGTGRLGPDFNVDIACDDNGIYRKSRDAVVFDDVRTREPGRTTQDRLGSLVGPLVPALLCEEYKEIFSHIEIVARQSIEIAKKLVGSSQGILLTDTTEKVVRRDFESVCQTAEIVERRLAGSGFEMGDGGGLKTCSFCQITLAQVTFFLERHEAGRKISRWVGLIFS